MRSVVVIAAAASGAFALVFSSVVLVWWAGFDAADCRGEECALELAAVVSIGLFVSALAAAVGGFAAVVALRARRRRETPSRDTG